MFMILLLACGAGTIAPGRTIDIIDGTYVGYPADGEPADGVRVLNTDSFLTVTFYDRESVLWAFVGFRGRMVVQGLVIKFEDSWIEGVTVDGDDLWCEVALNGVAFDVTGLFADERASLYLDITGVGTMTLYRQGPVDDTGGDSGAP